MENSHISSRDSKISKSKQQTIYDIKVKEHSKNDGFDSRNKDNTDKSRSANTLTSYFPKLSNENPTKKGFRSYFKMMFPFCLNKSKSYSLKYTQKALNANGTFVSKDVNGLSETMQLSKDNSNLNHKNNLVTKTTSQYEQSRNFYNRGKSERDF